MIHLKAIHSSSAFNLNQQRLLHIFKKKKKNPIISLCNKSNSSTDPDPSPPKGDARKQELLAKIAMLQTQKVRITEFLDERAAYLTRFAEEGNAEIDQVGENALEQLDQAGARIMENIESQMQAFEESAEVNRLEIEEDERQIAEFENLIEKERNEGLFFKNLKNRKYGAADRTKAKKDEKIGKLSGENSAGSRTRRNVYLLLIGVVGVGILDALISSSSYWQKPTILGIILVGLLSQIIYEQRMISEINREEKI
ncbi:hypothetical protein DM860_002814 [Cuscuta australis]|uniref:Uncharacterized protein n=1 Tax=Cuscuta australis TaxID=267555 RepID=A0A328D4D6_9ASTE|nr:hypothetical protein DM860_002814 [Cuscuta australis]